MVKHYRLGSGQRAANVVFSQFARRGWGHPYLHVLTVVGRSSGQERSTPVDVMEVGGHRYLVAPYGEVNWVRNLRVAKRATLLRGRRSQTYDAEEVTAAEAVPVIREYVRSVPITKAYWEVDNGSGEREVREDAKSHPVFRLRPEHSEAD